MFLNFFKKRKVSLTRPIPGLHYIDITNLGKHFFVCNGFLVCKYNHDDEAHYEPLTDKVIFSPIKIKKIMDRKSEWYEVSTSFNIATFLSKEDANKYADKMAELLQTLKNNHN